MAVLLIGNGINRSEGFTCSWDDLLMSACKDAKKKTGKDGSAPAASGDTTAGSETSKSLLPSVEGLTMTLGFDLQEFYAIDHGIAVSSTDLKKKIADSMQNQIENRIGEPDFRWEKTLHSAVMNLPISTYLTTNYDYTLENAADSSFKSRRGSSETVYSRFRKHVVSTGTEVKTVHHIHGEIHVPRSICLGFEHYSGSLEKIRSDIVRSTRNSEDSSDEHTFHLRDVMKGLKKENGEDEDDGSWYLKFFAEDIYILGLKLDFSEQDIWWLLDYRIRKVKYEKNDLGIYNHIYFLDTDAEARESEEKYASRNDLLRAFGVEIIYLTGANYTEKYRDAVRIIKTALTE